jgi:hypothetical protein
MLEKIRHVCLASGEEIVDAQHVVPFGKQSFAQVRSKETASPANQYFFQVAPFPGPKTTSASRSISNYLQ